MTASHSVDGFSGADPRHLTAAVSGRIPILGCQHLGSRIADATRATGDVSGATFEVELQGVRPLKPRVLRSCYLNVCSR